MNTKQDILDWAFGSDKENELTFRTRTPDESGGWAPGPGEIELKRSTRAYMEETLTDYSSEWTEAFTVWNKYQAARRQTLVSWRFPETCEQFLAYLKEFGFEFAGVYGEGKPFQVYDDESNLDQGFSAHAFSCTKVPEYDRDDILYSDAVAELFGELHEGEFVMFQGGSGAWIFSAELDSFLMLQDGTISCTGPNRHLWSTDDKGSHWYRDGAVGLGAGRQLQTYPIVDFWDVEGEFAKYKSEKLLELPESVPDEQLVMNILPDDEWAKDHRNAQRQRMEDLAIEQYCLIQEYIYVDTEGHGCCPICGARMDGY